MVKQKQEANFCWSCWHGNRGFPTFWVIVLIFAVTWFLEELGWVVFNIPWLATILIIVAFGEIINHYKTR
jgi:hypothetical protein